MIKNERNHHAKLRGSAAMEGDSVECVLRRRDHPQRGLEYLVRWRGSDGSDDGSSDGARREEVLGRAAEPDAHIFVINGFYMAMREKYTKPGESISYYLVEWDPKKLSWEDFRGKVLGPTSPADAPSDSLRGMCFANWKDYGLTAEPNTGDNGVHASASPFEAMAERNNWLGMTKEQDPFALGMLASGVSLETMESWQEDPQVQCGDDRGSLFDFLEDLDADDCLAKSRTIMQQ